MTRLPGIDFPIANFAASELDDLAASLVRRFKALRPPVTASRRALAGYQHDRSRLAYAAALCRNAAIAMREHDALTYADLDYEQSQQVVNATDAAIRQLAAGEPITTT